MDILNFLPLQICLLPNVIKNEIKFTITHNIEKPIFEIYYQKYSFKDKFQSFDTYKNKLFKSKKNRFKAINDEFKLKFNSKNFESTLITIYSKKPYRTQKYCLEILSFPYGESFVLGYCKLGITEKNLYDQEKVTKKEKLFIKKIFFIQNKKKIFSNCKKIIKAMYKIVGVQGTSKYIDKDTSFVDYFKYLKKGDSIQCGQVSLLLMKILQAFRVYYREVKLFRYYPPIEGIIINSHSVVEIYDESYNKWIMVDASYGIYIEDDSQLPLSIYEINKYLKNNELLKLKIVYLNKKLNYHKKYTAQIKVNRTKNEYDYFSHFNCICIRENNRDIYTSNIKINELES